MKLYFFIFFSVLAISALVAQSAVAPGEGDGSTDYPFQISSLENLYWIAAPDSEVPQPNQSVRWSSHYVQTHDIDASESVDWFDGEGWVPIGNHENNFLGSYNGQGFSISGLHISRAADYQGFFGYSFNAHFTNLNLNNIIVNGSDYTGGLVGYSQNSMIENCHVSGDLSGNVNIGLLAGRAISPMYEYINNCTSSGNINGAISVGGLIGEAGGNITNSGSSASVNAIENVGGLIGKSFLTFFSIQGSYSSGTVSGQVRVGGLIGYTLMNQSIIDCYSTSNVTGETDTGGLVGFVSTSGQIQNSYTTGEVSGYTNTGGLIGRTNRSVSVIHSYSRSIVSGNTNTGGLIGLSVSAVHYCWTAGIVEGNENTGGLIGLHHSSGDPVFSSMSSSIVNGDLYTGGLIGYNNQSSVINRCFSTGEVNGETYVGGLVGYGRRILNSYSTSNVSGTTYVGGLAGFNENLSTSINYIVNSYSTGMVTGFDNTGGLVGGSLTDIITNSYWNIETSGQTDSALGEGLFTEEMVFPYSDNVYLDWDFAEIWADDSGFFINNGYPVLNWQTEVLPLAYAYNPSPEDGSTGVSLETSLQWSYSDNEDYYIPDIFMLLIWAEGSEGPPSIMNIEGGTGDFLTEELPIELDFKTQYFWQVVPVLLSGAVYTFPENCPIWTFTTMDDLSSEDYPSVFVTELSGNYPNPFNPSTSIRFSLEKPDFVDLSIYNLKGQLIKSYSNFYQTGRHSIVWDGFTKDRKFAPSGFYLFKMETSDYSSTGKMLLIK